MKNFLDFLSYIIPFLAPYPVWIKAIVAIWLLFTTFMIICLLFGRPLKDQTAKNHTIASIQSISIEVRLTCDLKEGAEIPPAEVMFMPVGDSHSYFKGPPGTTRLKFISPVRFRRQDPNKIVVINRFSLESGSELQHKPLDVLKNYEKLSVPVITVVYGKSFKKLTLLEVVLTVNGQDIWYGSYKYDLPFQVGPRFEIPLEDLQRKLS